MSYETITSLNGAAWRVDAETASTPRRAMMTRMPRTLYGALLSWQAQMDLEARLRELTLERWPAPTARRAA